MQGVGDRREGIGHLDIIAQFALPGQQDAAVMQYLSTLQGVGNERDDTGHTGITTEITLPGKQDAAVYAVS